MEHDRYDYMTYQFASAQPGDLSAQFTGWAAFTTAQMGRTALHFHGSSLLSPLP